MSPEDALQLVLDKLDEHRIEYMVTGSFASSLYGIPRTTQDADIVFITEVYSLKKFIGSLKGDFFADEAMALDGLRTGLMFNVIHYQTGFKIDLIPSKNRSFDHEAFRRRQQRSLAGRARWVSSPEDVILTKLQWSQVGESERQFADAVSIAEVQAENLEWNYLAKWAAELKISSMLEKLKKAMNR